jgi:hypothetical protein
MVFKSLEVVDPCLLAKEVFSLLVLGFFGVFFRMVRRRRLPKFRIMSFLSYPRFTGASSYGGGCMNLCVGRIPLDPVSFRVCWCGFRLGSSGTWFLVLAMVAAPVLWYTGVFARQVRVCLQLHSSQIRWHTFVEIYVWPKFNEQNLDYISQKWYH